MTALTRLERYANVAVCIAAALVLISPVRSAAQDRTITAVSPAQASQGDTVLLTIEGQNLPTGTVTVEFFPDQIALLDILSASASSIEAQIKIPSLAPPGAYNILIYNHLGDEAFGQGLFSVASDVLTPVFRDYDPKVIARATSGFALLLTGEGVTAQVVDHLSMQWQRRSGDTVDLETTFTAGGTGQILCAVTGDLPSGVLLGRIFLDGTPIYLVEITIESGTGMIVGHRPAEIDASEFPYKFTLLGTDLTASFIAGMEVQLASADTTARPMLVELLDPASVASTINGPLPAGDYELVVKFGGEQIYAGKLSLTSSPQPPLESPPDEAPAEVEFPPQDGALDSALPVVEEPAQPPFGIESVVPQAIPAGNRPASLALIGAELRAEALEDLTFELAVEDKECSLLFLGAGGEAYTCLFAPPEGGWQSGTNPRLTISDPSDAGTTFTADLLVEVQAVSAPEPTRPAAEPAAPAVPLDAGDALPPVSPEGWAVAQAYVDESPRGNALVIVLNAPDASWDPALIDASFTLLPADSAALECFANLSTEGHVTFRRSESGVPIGNYPGNFVAGDLLVRLAYDGGPPEISGMQLDASPPPARLSPSPVEYVRRNPQSGELSPQSLRCVVDFSPFVIADAGFLLPRFTPTAVAGPHPQLEAEGTQVALVIDLGAWSDVEDWEEGLLVEIDSVCELAWEGDASIHIPVRQASAQAPPPVIKALTTECALHSRGFSLLIDPGDSELAADRFGVVEVRSDHLLLDRNLSAFEVAAVEAGIGDERMLSLRFTRDPAVLDDLVYGLLVEELIEAQAVQLDLVWPELGATVSQSVTFVAAPEDGVEDVLDELGLIAPD